MKNEIIKMLDVFASNSFLIPSTHTPYQQFTNLEEEYSTYADSGRQYISIQIRQAGVEVHKTKAYKFRDKWSIESENLLEAKSVKTQLAKHYKYIKAIYEEVHCLNVDKVKIKEIREKIGAQKATIQIAQTQIDLLQKQIKDSKAISNQITQ